MTPQERKSLAEQLIGNPLYHAVFADLEKAATEAMIYTTDDTERLRLAMRVQTIRAFRQDCEAALRNTQPQKGAVA